jgi:hypothetical protein
MSELSLCYEGVKGKGGTLAGAKGMINLMIDGIEDAIIVDAFQGYGDKYNYPNNPFRRREQCLIKIGDFQGTFQELIERLKQ